MSEAGDNRLNQDEALILLNNRILFDFISLQIDRGQFTLEEAKKLVRFSAAEVKHGAPGLTQHVDFLAKVLIDRFDETDYDAKQSG